VSGDGRQGKTLAGHGEVDVMAEQLLRLVAPPDGVRLTGTRPSRTGEGGRGVLARYSDGTTVSAMVNSDGSVCILLFRNGEAVPAVPSVRAAGDAAGAAGAGDGAAPRFTWRPVQ
jgi:hypothetical protein